MTITTLPPVTLTKMCKLHGIALPRDGALTASFRTRFPEAVFDETANEWRIVWEKGHFAASNAQIVAFFESEGVSAVHVDRC